MWIGSECSEDGWEAVSDNQIFCREATAPWSKFHTQIFRNLGKVGRSESAFAIWGREGQIASEPRKSGVRKLKIRDD